MHDIHIPSSIEARYLTPAKGTTLLFGGFAAVGAVAFFLLLGGDPGRAWQAYVANWLFWTGLAQGAIIFCAATVITKAKWNWPIRRISLALGAFLPISYLLMLPMLGLREDYFVWMTKMEYDEIVAMKAAYLNIPFLIVRNLVGPAVLFSMSLYFMYTALRPDLGPDRAGAEGGSPSRARWRERLTGNWLGQEAEEERAWQRLKVLSPALALVYAFVMSFVVVDFAMSLEPHWFSTLFPVWYFMAAFWGGIATTGIIMVLLKRKDPYFDEHMGPQQQHDIAKLTFAFSIFWTYLFFSQYIVQWYGKLPWEQEWYLDRSTSEWGPLSLLVIGLCFATPFILLMARKAKMNPLWYAGVASLAMFGLWLERWLLIAPTLNKAPEATLTFWEPLIGLGFLGVFALTVRWFLSTFPVIQLWQPKPEPEMLERETHVVTR
jgi:hypothetical protein